MATVKQYFTEIMIVCLPAIIIFLCFKPYRMNALAAMKLKSTWQRETALVLFIIAISGILALTLWPAYIWEESPGLWGHLRILIGRPTWDSNLSLVPFAIFKDYSEDLLRSPVFFFVTLINLIGNIAIFIPIGLFPALLFRNASWKRSAILGFVLSSLIEFLQYFIMRNTAVDDIILNTFGAICGYLIYLLMRKKLPIFTLLFLCQEQ